jgi:hypothetical protein
MHPERVPVAYGLDSRKRRKSVEDEEARAWVRFYRRASDAEVAVEVLALLESDIEVRRDHPALVLLCRESLRRQKAEQQRRRRIAQAIRTLTRHLILIPASAFRRASMAAIDVLVECFQQTSRDRMRQRSLR